MSNYTKILQALLSLSAGSLTTSCIVNNHHSSSINNSSDIAKSNLKFKKQSPFTNYKEGDSRYAVDAKGNTWTINYGSPLVLMFNGHTVTLSSNYEVYDLFSLGNATYFIAKDSSNKVKLFKVTNITDPKDVAKDIKECSEIDVTGKNMDKLNVSFIDGVGIVVYGHDATSNNWHIYVSNKQANPHDATETFTFTELDLKAIGTTTSIDFSGSANMKIVLNHHENTVNHLRGFIITDTKVYYWNPAADGVTTQNEAIEVKNGASSIANATGAFDVLNKQGIEEYYVNTEDKMYQVENPDATSNWNVAEASTNLSAVGGKYKEVLADSDAENEEIFVIMTTNVSGTNEDQLYIIQQKSLPEAGNLTFELANSFDPALSNPPSLLGLNVSGSGLLNFMDVNSSGTEKTAEIYMQHPLKTSTNSLVVILASVFGVIGVVGISLLLWYFYLRNKQTHALATEMVARKEINDSKISNSNKKDVKSLEPKTKK